MKLKATNSAERKNNSYVRGLHPLFDLFKQNIDFHGSHCGEECEEQEEGDDNATRIEVAHSSPCGQ